MGCPFSTTCPVLGGQNAGEGLEQRRFSAAIGADKGGDLARLNLQIDIADNGGVAVADGEILCSEERRSHAAGSCAVSRRA